jgi:ferredoxin-NADP reductase
MLLLRVDAIKPETADTKTFYLKPVSGRRVPYQAGQFITLVINHHQEEVRRSYSLSSSPDEDGLAITVKRIPNGEVTRYLHLHAQVGDVWQVVPPAGRFTLPTPVTAQHLVYFVAGSGISPVYAHIKYVLRHYDNNQVFLFYSNLNRQSIIFYKELETLAQQYPGRLTVVHLISEEGKRLNNLVAEQLVRQHLPQQYAAAEYYLCGPFTYMRTVRLTLLFMHIAKQRIHQENYVLETVPTIHETATFAPRNVRIYFNHEWHNLTVAANQTLLQAALQNNLQLPYSCGSGVCAACAVKCPKGRVTLVKNEVLTDAEIKQGWVLTCTGYATSDDVELTFDY